MLGRILRRLDRDCVCCYILCRCKKMTPEEKRKSVSDWFRYMSNILSVDDKSGVIIIDGLDELVTDRDNRIDDILSLLPESLPSNIKVVLSCISEDILPATIIGKLLDEFKIEVTPLNMQACESYIKANSGEWEKTFPFIQAVAHKTQGHPLYMNYLCRYMAESFDEKTKEVELEEWLDSLPTIGGDITAYYESIWKKQIQKDALLKCWLYCLKFVALYWNHNYLT